MSGRYEQNMVLSALVALPLLGLTIAYHEGHIIYRNASGLGTLFVGVMILGFTYFIERRGYTYDPFSFDDNKIFKVSRRKQIPGYIIGFGLLFWSILIFVMNIPNPLALIYHFRQSTVSTSMILAH